MIVVFVIFVVFSTTGSRSNAFTVTRMRMRRRSPAGDSRIVARGRAIDHSDMTEHRSLNDATNVLIGRRTMIHSLIISTTYKSIASHAADDNDSVVLSKNLSYEIPPKHDVIIKAICDPTVESYRKGPSRIHIVGTAHISSVSSRLSKDAVRETKVRIMI